MIENTSETKASLGNYTIPELETIVEAISENNKPADDKGGNKYTDWEAIQFLQKNQGTL
jgi:hypothetical protein